jgi:hypothetical protein
MEFAETTGFTRTISWSPFSLAVLVLGMLVILAGPRKWVLTAFLALSTLMSMALHVVVFGLNLMPHRIFLLCAWARFLLGGEYRSLVFSRMDKAFILFCSSMVIMEALREATPGFVYGVANSGLDALGTYFLCRILIRERGELTRAVTSLAAVCVAVAGFMCLEFLTRRNLLTALGAVQDFVQVRQGRMRCAASFSVPITAGTFGAVLLPLFVACWWQGERLKRWAVAGCIASTIITVTAGSAGPLSTYVFGIFGLLAWPLRRHMRKFRWGVGLSLLALHMVMKAPVWALIARMQVVPGASAYHRFNILDTFINNIDKWWLSGLKTTADWGWLMDDVANQYCVVAKHGGLLALVLFIWVLKLGFREVGLTLKGAGDDRPCEFLAWAFGVMLFGHLTSFFGISYYDQMKILWYLTLGMVASVGLLAQGLEQSSEPEEASASLEEFPAEVSATAQ